MSGFPTLFYKEWMRFWKVSVQTILAPVLTALLFLVVFAYSLRGRVEIWDRARWRTQLKEVMEGAEHVAERLAAQHD